MGVALTPDPSPTGRGEKALTPNPSPRAGEGSVTISRISEFYKNLQLTS